jgi:hypothetical protein
MFYTIVLSIAIIVLIIILTGFGIILSKTKQNIIFPPTKNTCPDYWSAQTNGNTVVCKLNPKNLGDLSSKTKGNVVTYNLTTTSGSKYFTPGYNASNKTVDFTDSTWSSAFMRSNQCALKYWSNKHAISWDGVANYNGC